MKPLFVDYEHSVISISSAFKKKAFTPGTCEYKKLIQVRRDFPEFGIEVREFKTNTKQEHYRGLTYGYMRDYISSHEKNPKPILDELDEAEDVQAVYHNVANA